MANQLYQNAGGDDGRYVIDSKAGGSFGEAQGSEARKLPAAGEIFSLASAFYRTYQELGNWHGKAECSNAE